MSTSQHTIRQWLKEGKKLGATHMIVAVDSYDHDDYPVYVMSGQDVRVEEARVNASSMQRVMEVYSYKLDLEQQLGQGRAFNYD